MDEAPMVVRGFTLADTLIALAILGVVALFTVPKLLQSAQDERRIATFKQTYAQLGAVMGDYCHEPMTSRTVSKAASYILSRLNAIKTCNTSMVTQGCVPASYMNIPGDIVLPGVMWNEQPGAVLPNGAIVMFWTDCRSSACGSGDRFMSLWIDWNGLSEPNTSVASNPNQGDLSAFYINVSKNTAGAINACMVESYVSPSAVGQAVQAWNRKYIFQ